jgi:hypothetical protein
MFAFLWERNREKGGRRGHRDMGKARRGQVSDRMTTRSEALSLPAYRLTGLDSIKQKIDS